MVIVIITDRFTKSGLRHLYLSTCDLPTYSAIDSRYKVMGSENSADRVTNEILKQNKTKTNSHSIDASSFFWYMPFY